VPARRQVVIVLAALAVLAAGTTAGILLPKSGENASNCATATAPGTTVAPVTVPAHTVGVDNSDVSTIPGVTVPGVTINDSTATLCVSSSTSTPTTVPPPTTTPPQPGLAELWIGTGACIRSPIPVAFNAADSCPAFQAAYLAAQPGDRVLVPCGDYTAESKAFVNLTYTAAKDDLASNIVFSSQDGTRGCVTLPNVIWTVQTGHVEFHHFTLDQTACVDSPTVSVPPCPSIVIQSSGVGALTGANHVVFDDIQTSQLGISGSVNHITIENVDVGPMWDNHGLLGCNGSANCLNGTAVPHDILIQDVAFHDFYNTTACKNNIPAGCHSAHHQGCALSVNAGYNLVFNRDHFYNCQDLPFYVHPYIGEVHDLTVENSDIGRNAAPAQMQNDYATSTSSPGYWAVKFINNTMGSMSLLPSSKPNACAGQGGSGGCEWVGNINGASALCSKFTTGWLVEGNASTGNYCGTGTLLAGATGSPTPCGTGAVCRDNYKTTSYGLATDGYHLTPSSPLTNQLPAALPWLPPHDIDGESRTPDSAPGDDD
jgi:hypothetical protein